MFGLYSHEQLCSRNHRVGSRHAFRPRRSCRCDRCWAFSCCCCSAAASWWRHWCSPRSSPGACSSLVCTAVQCVRCVELIGSMCSTAMLIFRFLPASVLFASNWWLSDPVYFYECTSLWLMTLLEMAGFALIVHSSAPFRRPAFTNRMLIAQFCTAPLFRLRSKSTRTRQTVMSSLHFSL